MRALLASGGNYMIHIDDGIVDVRVWKRPDVSAVEGARFAQEKVEHLGRIAVEPAVTSLILDLSDAPPVVGPRTQQAIIDMCAGFIARALPIVIVVGTSPTQRMQVERLARTADAASIHVVNDSEEGFALLRP